MNVQADHCHTSYDDLLVQHSSRNIDSYWLPVEADIQSAWLPHVARPFRQHAFSSYAEICHPKNDEMYFETTHARLKHNGLF